MNTKTPIKVIKRGERNRQEQAAGEAVSNAKKSAQETAREMVATVTEWVNEFQQKRRMETSQAIKTLLRPERTPQTSKA
ncbi:MAG TPA: hypothetical protein VGV59_09395 [Pyrinomonadaceae bacterium]|nr:hypothetical protein [Pyrinomonadaceae bacterium]